MRGGGACCIVHAITSICNHTCSMSCSWNQAENRPAVRDVYIFCIIYKVKAYANQAMGYVQRTMYNCTSMDYGFTKMPLFGDSAEKLVFLPNDQVTVLPLPGVTGFSS